MSNVKWGNVLESKSGNLGDWVVGQWEELADFSKLCKWSEQISWVIIAWVSGILVLTPVGRCWTRMGVK